MEKNLERIEIGQYLVIDPEICHGQLTFKGTRIPVDAALTYLWLGNSMDVLLHGWPELSRPALLEAMRLAAEALQEKYDYPGKLPANYEDELEATVARVTNIVLDDQLYPSVRLPIERWIRAMRLRDARPRQIIKDERAPTILRTLRRPTFITIDMWYWERS